jgi:DNA-binding transcriptional MerR regulator
MAELELKVGELAERTGLTVRTLHWYDDIGLLSPRRRTEAGHRIYGPREIERLQKILSLRKLGLSLEKIQEALDRDDLSLVKVLELHAEDVAREVERLRALGTRLRKILDTARETGRVEAEELILTMEAMAMFEKYYTPEQLEKLEKRREKVGEERIRQVQEEWEELYRRFGEQMAAGAGPDDPQVLALARKARSLIREFTGGDPGIRASLERMYSEEGTRPLDDHGVDVDPRVHEFLNRAVQALGEDDAGE